MKTRSPFIYLSLCLSFILLSGVFTSCSDDDEPEVAKKYQLVVKVEFPDDVPESEVAVVKIEASNSEKEISDSGETDNKTISI